MFSTRIFIIWTIWITIISCKVTGQKNQPNVVLILTDDLDLLQGGMNPLNKTRNLIGDAGITFENSFVSTPVVIVVWLTQSARLKGKIPRKNNDVIDDVRDDVTDDVIDDVINVTDDASEKRYKIIDDIK